MTPSFLKSAFWIAMFLLTCIQGALSQRCPPNAHARTVAIPGNLQTAHCWCNDGYQNVRGVCVRVTPAPTAGPERGLPIAPDGSPARR